MRSVDFCYWLQGFFELTDPETIDDEQTEMIRRHLALVFKHEIDPSYTAGLSEKEAKQKQKVLNEIHSPNHALTCGVAPPPAVPGFTGGGFTGFKYTYEDTKSHLHGPPEFDKQGNPVLYRC